MRKITPEAMLKQWQDARHRLDVNVWDFEALAGAAAKEIFQGSFAKGRFNSVGSKRWPTPVRLQGKGWAKRGGKRIKDMNGHFVHKLSYSSWRSTAPTLDVTGALKDSITWMRKKRTGGNSYVKVYTQTGSSWGRHLNFYGYMPGCGNTAAPHNFGVLVMENGGRLPARQFMGHSTYMEKKLKSLSRIIFRGFPGCSRPVFVTG